MYLRLTKLICLLTLSLLTTGSSVAKPEQPMLPSEPVAKAPFEVRLRKLHLVRPDLIPYPISFEVYC